jgi:hypothetical protein
MPLKGGTFGEHMNSLSFSRKGLSVMEIGEAFDSMVSVLEAMDTTSIFDVSIYITKEE